MITTSAEAGTGVRCSTDATCWELPDRGGPVRGRRVLERLAATLGAGPGDCVELELAGHWATVCDLLAGAEVPVDHLREAVIVLSAALDELRRLATAASVTDAEVDEPLPMGVGWDR
ncbi:MAG: hypothetical protein ACRCYU_13315 [Nocardioides sp.]